MKETLVTPQMAQQLLGLNRKNRNPIARQVAYLEKILKSGNWLLTTDAIGIDEDGNLQNGQHRLMAIANTGIAAPVYIVHGLSRDAFWVEGTGATKKASDALAIAGETNAKNLAAAAVVLVNYDRSKTLSPIAQRLKIDSSSLFESINNHPDVRAFVAASSHGSQKRAPGFLMAFCGIMTIAAEKYGFDLVMDFYQKYRLGLGLSQNDPAYVLRERMVDAGGRASITPQFRCAYFIKALSAHCNGKEIRILRWQENETFPTI